MGFERFLFYFFSIVLVLSALRVITVRNPVHAVLFLVLCFFTSSALWLLLQAEFLAIALVLVYVGAVMVLFLFVVMMLDVNVTPLREGFIKNAPLGLAIAVVIVIEMFLVIASSKSGGVALSSVVGPVEQGANFSNTKELGGVLYTLYAYPFELAATVLLVAIVAAIALTMRRRSGVKYVDPAKQVVISREGRVRLVNIPVAGDKSEG